MRSFFSEKNLVVILFVLVLVVFSLAQEDSRKLEKINSGAGVSVNTWQPVQHTAAQNKAIPAANKPGPAEGTE